MSTNNDDGFPLSLLAHWFDEGIRVRTRGLEPALEKGDALAAVRALEGMELEAEHLARVARKLAAKIGKEVES